ncbi:MAG: hypothetical protein R2744_01405 [Bacteroidales bacterium]
MKKASSYYDNAHVWWCSHCKIVCANEEVLTDGNTKSAAIQLKKEPQWMLRIQHYAERLLSGLESVDWPEG